MTKVKWLITALAALCGASPLYFYHKHHSQRLPALYARCLVAALTKPRKLRQGATIPEIAITTALAWDAHRLAPYLALTGWQGSGTVPALSIPVETFRLVLWVLAAPAFPLSALGGLLTRHSVTQHLPLAAVRDVCRADRRPARDSQGAQRAADTGAGAAAGRRRVCCV